MKMSAACAVKDRNAATLKKKKEIEKKTAVTWSTFFLFSAVLQKKNKSEVNPDQYRKRSSPSL